MKLTALLATLVLTALPTISLAGPCIRADFTGTWRIYTVFDSVSRCTIIMPSAGKTVSSKSSCYLPDIINSIPLKGSLTLSPDCHVIGSISINAQQHTIDAWISKGKDSISGIGWKPGNVLTGNVFSGVKQ